MGYEVFQPCLLKKTLNRLWIYRYEGAMLNYLQSWIDQLPWQLAAHCGSADGPAPKQSFRRTTS